MLILISHIWGTSGSARPFPGWQPAGGKEIPWAPAAEEPFSGLEKGDEEDLWGCSAWMGVRMWRRGGGRDRWRMGNNSYGHTPQGHCQPYCHCPGRSLNVVFTLQTRKVRVRESGHVWRDGAGSGTRLPNFQGASPPASLRLSGWDGGSYHRLPQAGGQGFAKLGQGMAGAEVCGETWACADSQFAGQRSGRLVA